MLSPLDTKSSLADQIYEQLIDSILAGGLTAGEHLVMDRLAEELGVSRTPVRDALARLERDGLVESANRGYVIREVGPDDIGAIYQARAAVEVFAARLVAAKPAEVRARAIDAIAGTVAAADRLRDSDDPVTAFKANRAVHRAIVAATGNTVLVDCFDTIWNTSVVAYAFAQLHWGARRQAGVDGAAPASGIPATHTELLAALDSGDPDRAAAAMADHLPTGEHHTGY